MKKQKAPNELKKAGKMFWQKVCSEYEIHDAHDLERLNIAAKTLDDLDEIEQRIKKDGLFTVNRYGSTVEHPGSKMIRDYRALFVRVVRELGLDLTTGPEARPPQRY